MLKMPVVSLKDDRSSPNFFSEKCAKNTECVPVSLSYDICCAFQNLQHVTIVGNFLYAKIKSNEY